MGNLIKIEGKNDFLNMNEIPMHPEEEIEKMLWENKGILGSDIYLLSRQITSYGGSDRIDILGLDSDNNIVIVEVKDEEVDERVISQVMRYAFWVETNPDSVKTLYLEKKDKEEDFEFDWSQKPSIRILIVAPSFNQDIRKLVGKVNYEIELIELKKFNDGKNDLIFVNQLDSQEVKPYKASTLRYSGEYGEEFYKSQRNPNSVPIFLKIADLMGEYIKNKGWNLVRSNNKNYISFKYGFPVVCGVKWIGSKSLALFFKISKETAESIKIQDFPLLRYEDQWNEASYKIDSVNLDLTKFDKLFEASYKSISGK